jgi:phosphatidylinositol alpha-1,6-mannosyltransferase
MSHLLVTNDFPPKVGGIQSYLWELWRRLPPDEFAVLTTPSVGADSFDRAQPFCVERARQRWLLPTPAVRAQIHRAAERRGASFVVLDPAVPLGHVGPSLDLPYAVLVHGAEVTVPGRVPGPRGRLARVLRGARLVIANSDYVAGEAERVAGRSLPGITVHPAVDGSRFHPLPDDERSEVRRSFGLPGDGLLVLGFSRLVRRKGFDVLIEAVARLARGRTGLRLAIGGDGRDRGRLERLAGRLGAPATFLGRVSDDRLPGLIASADVFAMLCRNQWGGIEQEGFGIVFIEAAAAGVPQIAGRSGGAAEAVLDSQTGLVVDRPHDVADVVEALATLLDDEALRARLGAAARARMLADFDQERLAARLHRALAALP